MIKKTLLIVTFSVLIFTEIPAQLRETAFQMNKRLGRGINMGNCFEATSESAWGNPWKPEYFRIMSDLGFRHVRIPIRWEPADRSDLTAPYTIKPWFFSRIRQVVDTALKYKLHVIINMHHHDSLTADPAREKARFISQWGQIATYFRSYTDSLLFEVLNEPHDKMSATLWNTCFADALTEIRKTNPARCVVMGVAEYGGLSALGSLQFPNDENMILTIHYYNPFHFTHQGAEWSGEEAKTWLGTKWNDTEIERKSAMNEFSYALWLSKQQHIPIHIGEFGAYSKADEASRVRWTTFLSRWFEEQGFSWAYWEFSAGFGIYNPATKKLLTPLVGALLTNPMPEPAKVEARTIYASNFNTGNDGWSVNFSSGASGTSSRSGGKLFITITNGGTESWHVQLVRNGIRLENGKKYYVSFTGKSPVFRSVTAYTGKAGSPWSAYSSYDNFQFPENETNMGFVFTMNSATDNSARIVFDLGKSVTGITISDIRIEEIMPLTTVPVTGQARLMAYPTPFIDRLYIENSVPDAIAEILTLAGIRTGKYRLLPGKNSLMLKNLPSGAYLLKVSGNNQTESRIIVKN